MIRQRVKQVMAALTARIEMVDRQFVAYHLNIREAGLFWRMNTPDQKHALNVARTAMELWNRLIKEQATADVGLNPANRHLLLKAALLHDVGKVKGDISTIDKVLAVLADRFCSRAARRWSRAGRGGALDNLRHAFYVYYHHAARSAAMLEECGVETAVVDMVRRHHQQPQAGDPPELILLRQADDLH